MIELKSTALTDLKGVSAMNEGRNELNVCARECCVCYEQDQRRVRGRGGMIFDTKGSVCYIQGYKAIDQQ